MREWGLILGNYALFTIGGIFLIGFQSIVWFQFFGRFPPPNLWLPILVYWTLYRRMHEGALMAYLLSFLIATASAVPLNLILALNVLLLVLGSLLKQKIYWPGATYFMMVTAMGAALVSVLHFILSQFFEANSVADFQFLHWIGQTLLSALFALPIYRLLSVFDSLTRKQLPADSRLEQL